MEHEHEHEHVIGALRDLIIRLAPQMSSTADVIALASVGEVYMAALRDDVWRYGPGKPADATVKPPTA